jgi:multidrug efflux pump subunit AcrB
VHGLVDAHIQQPDDAPAINIRVDRTKAMLAGLTQKQIAQDMLISLSGSSQTTPNFWLDPKNGVSYPLMAQVPQYDIHSLQTLANLPLDQHAASSAPQSILASLGSMQRGSQQAVVSHYNVQPVIDIYASVQGRDLGGVAADVSRLIAQSRAHLPGGSTIVMRGQVQSMTQSFSGLGFGLVFAIALV